MNEGVATPISDVVPEEALVSDGDWGPMASGAEAIVLPGSVDEVVDVMRWAGASGTRIVPVGTGRHMRPASVGGRYAVVSTHRLSGVEIYEPADLTITAGAGLRVSDLSDEAGQNNQWLPFDPPDFPSRSLGGLAASGSTGPLWAGYGEVKNHVLGATVVCGDGRRLRLGGRVVKNVAGFDLLRAVVGSRGALAVITSVTLRLFPVPAVDRVLVLKRERLIDLVPAARAVAVAPISPVSVVLSGAAGAAKLLVRLHGAAKTVDADQATLAAAAGVDFQAAEGNEAGGLIREARDRAAGKPHVATMFGLPTALGDLVRRAEGVPGAVVTADASRCAVTIGTEDPLPDLEAGVETVSGAVAELTAGIKKVFDPASVLWSSRS